MRNHKILIIDDENDILDLLHHCLEIEGYKVKSTNSGEEGLKIMKEFEPELILVDFNMPDVSGISICETIRKKLSKLNPIIIFFSSEKKWEIHLKGYEAGADDFIVKPVKTKILIKKVDVWLKRYHKTEKIAFTDNDGSISIDADKHIVKINDTELYFRKKEFDILKLLMSKPNHIFNKEEIMRKVWDDDVIVSMKNIDVHIKKLRDKIGKDRIKTLKGIGYKFVQST